MIKFAWPNSLFVPEYQDPEEQRYLVDSFWLQSLSWKQKLNALAFSNLFEARDLVNSLYNLALENNMEEGQSQMGEYPEVY